MVNTHQLGEPLPQKIVIVRSLPGLGDLLCAVPAWRSLRAALPDAQITLLGLPGAQSFVERFSKYLDHFIQFPGYPGIPEVTLAVEKLPAFFAHVQQQQFDLAVQMHGSGIVSNAFTMLLGARINAGFYLPGQYCPDAQHFLPYPENEPEVWRHLRLMEFLGIPLQGTELEFPLLENDFAALHAIEAVRSLQPKAYVCIHPGASVPEKRWSPQKFAVIADALAARGFPVVLTGTTAELELTQTVQQLMNYSAINLAGCTSLGAIAALLSQARLLVCNDTGISHLAAALRVQSVVIFSASDPERWAPLDRDRHRVLLRSQKTAGGAGGVGGVGEVGGAIPNFKSQNDSPLTLEMVMTQVEDLLSSQEVTYVA